MTLEQLNILAAVWAGLGLITLFARKAYIWTRPKTTVSDTKESDSMDIQRFRQKLVITEKDVRTLNIMVIVTALCLVVSLILVFASAHYRHSAIKCGAQDDIDEQPVSEIKYFTDHGFADQSDSLPDDLTGVIIVYFLYGCKDCADIHDDLVSMISSRNIENIYFVSVSSEKGRAIFDSHFPTGGREVPSAVYISKADTHAVLLFEPSNTNNEKSAFIAENLQSLIDLRERTIS